MAAFAFHEGARCSSDLLSEGFGEGSPGDEVGAAAEEKPDQLGIPTEENVRERNRRDVSTKIQKEFDELKIAMGDGIQQPLILLPHFHPSAPTDDPPNRGAGPRFQLDRTRW